jgi:hypothetical protein
MDSIPKSYYIGQEFTEDKEKIEVEIMMYFYSKALIDPFEFYYLGKKITATREGIYLKIFFNINVSRKLVEEARATPVEKFVIGYISKYFY